MPDPVVTEIGGLFPLALAGFGVTMLVAVTLIKRTTGNKTVAAMSGADDLLQEDEAAITAALSVTKSPETLETAVTPDTTGATTDSTDDEDRIDWKECEDVYRPTTVDADRFAHALCPERSPGIEPKQNYIFIRQSAYAQLREHLRRDMTVELGGLLCGEAFYEPGRSIYLLVIQAALPATEGIETATSFSYTAASWQALMPRLQQLNPAWTLIGSYHSHPGLGVFLSETDLGTQENIFAQDWQVALVVDPVADELGFFVGREGSPCSEWRILPDLAN